MLQATEAGARGQAGTMQERSMRERDTRARDGETRKENKNPRARSLRVDSTYETKYAAGGKNRGICRRPPEAGYRGVHSISAYSRGDAKRPVKSMFSVPSPGMFP